MDRENIFDELSKTFIDPSVKKRKKQNNTNKCIPSFPLKALAPIQNLTNWIDDRSTQLQIGPKDEPVTFRDICNRHSSLSQRIIYAELRFTTEPIKYFNHCICKAMLLNEDKDDDPYYIPIWCILSPSTSSQDIERVQPDNIIRVKGVFDANNIVYIHTFKTKNHFKKNQLNRILYEPIVIARKSSLDGNSITVSVIRSVVLESGSECISLVKQTSAADTFLVLHTKTSVLDRKCIYTLNECRKLRSIELNGPRKDLFAAQLIKDASAELRVAARIPLIECNSLCPINDTAVRQ
ncbi:hypothetical protein ACOME3_008620 [Neoechinorhynchus agilis]